MELPSVQILMHVLFSSWPNELTKELNSNKWLIIFIGTFLVHFTHAKRPRNSIPLIQNVSVILGLLVKFTNIYHHFDIFPTSHWHSQLSFVAFCVKMIQTKILKTMQPQSSKIWKISWQTTSLTFCANWTFHVTSKQTELRVLKNLTVFLLDTIGISHR